MTHTSRTGVLAGCLRWFIIAGSFAFGSAQAAGHDDIEALRRDIDALKKGQDAIAADVAEIKQLLEPLRPPPPVRPAEGTLDIAAMGNLMATAAVVRGMAGMVLDGAIRDMWDIRRMGLTVYARSKSPRTAVGHYATVAKNIPVECAGVTVRPGDIIVADEDGVVVVPQDRAGEVLKEAQSIDARESGMYPFIRQFKSLQEAIKKFNRI